MSGVLHQLLTAMTHTIELERETDGRWIAEVPAPAAIEELD